MVKRIVNNLFCPEGQIVWSAFYTSASIGLGHLVSRLFQLPQWVTPACSFNNTTSLPLLLLQSLDSAGSLKVILREGEDTTAEIERAQSYFLVCAVVSKTIAYIVGPKMLHEGEGPSSQLEDGDIEEQGRDQLEGDEQLTENTSLLPQRAQKARQTVGSRMQCWRHWIGSFLPQRAKQKLIAPFEDPFADVAVCCMLLGALLGLVPALHRAFFARVQDGGIFHAWLTTSVRNMGRLFTTLQIFVVGCKLGVMFERMMAKVAGEGESEGEDVSGRTPVKAIMTIFLIRLVVWPALSISLVYGVAKKSTLLGDDPMLWFSMMLMPAGPPALVILGLAELAQASESEKMAIAKTLTVSSRFCLTIDSKHC